mgnify:CR=1 FL=1
MRTSLVALAALVAATPALADPLKVVASFSIVADIVETVGGDEVEVIALVGPNEDAHVYAPTPQDARAVAEADLVVVNGLEFEGWMDRLIDASGYEGPIVVAARGVNVLDSDGEEHGDHDDHDDHDDHGHSDEAHGDDDHDHGDEEHAKADDHDHDHGEEEQAKADDHDHDHDHGEEEQAKADDHDHDHDHGEEEHAEADDHDHAHGEEEHAGHDDHGDHHGHDHGEFDPHAWQDPAAGAIYAANIAQGLSALHPEDSAMFLANAAALAEELTTIADETRAALADIPEAGRIIVVPHDAFQYAARAYGIESRAIAGISTTDFSAAEFAELIEELREVGAAALFTENISDTRTIEQLKAETGIEIGGELFSDALSDDNGPASTYTDFLRANAATLIAGLTGG